MYLHELRIEGYKTFGHEFTVELSKGLNVLVGENGVGKSALVDAIRLLLLEDEFGRTPITDTDFHQPFTSTISRSEGFRISAQFSGLSREETVAFLPWTDMGEAATLSLQVDNKVNYWGRYKRHLWGGASRASIFEWDLFDTINCIYLPALRDAEAKLREGKGSRLARLMKNLTRQDRESRSGEKPVHPLETRVREFNKQLADDENEVVARTNKMIKDELKKALGSVLCQDTLIEFSEANFNRIVESLRLLFFPNARTNPEHELFRTLEENSLGYNNLLYLATVLAELANPHEGAEYLRLLLIEEPEAHLHPQLQIRLLKYLEQAALESSVQVVITTHSPVLASAASLKSIVHFSQVEEAGTTSAAYMATPLRDCNLRKPSEQFVSRWLDVTKSTLLFAKGIILVEGIAEAMLLPVLARRILKKHNQEEGEKPDAGSPLPESLEDAAVSVINMNGIYFEHFLPLFCNLDEDDGDYIPIRCAGITDQDPPRTLKRKGSGENRNELPFRPTCSDIDKAKSKNGVTYYRFPPAVISGSANEWEEPSEFRGRNPALQLHAKIEASRFARLYCGQLKTFEYDLAMEGSNLGAMLPVLHELWPTQGEVKSRLEDLKKRTWDKCTEEQKAKAAFEMLKRINDDNVGKGVFAQVLAEKLEDPSVSFAIPQYIEKAVIWACGGNPDGKA